MADRTICSQVGKRWNCAIYTRKSVAAGLEREFNTLESQREMCANYITSNRENGWIELPSGYDDGGQSGGTLARPALQRLMADVEQGLADFVRLIEHTERSLRPAGGKLASKINATARASRWEVGVSFRPYGPQKIRPASSLSSVGRCPC